MAVYHALSGSAAEDLFIDLFSEGFGFLFPREWVEILQRKEPLQLYRGCSYVTKEIHTYIIVSFIGQEDRLHCVPAVCVV